MPAACMMLSMFCCFVCLGFVGKIPESTLSEVGYEIIIAKKVAMVYVFKWVRLSQE